VIYLDKALSTIYILDLLSLDLADPLLCEAAFLLDFYLDLEVTFLDGDLDPLPLSGWSLINSVFLINLSWNDFSGIIPPPETFLVNYI